MLNNLSKECTENVKNIAKEQDKPKMIPIDLQLIHVSRGSCVMTSSIHQN